MTHDFKAALDWFQSRTHGYAIKHPQQLQHVDAIYRALRIADKLMQEPCYPMENAGKWASFERCEGDEELEEFSPDNDECSAIFKAMRDQMLKEIE